MHPPDLETVVRLGDPSKAASLNDLAVLYQFQGHRPRGGRAGERLMIYSPLLWIHSTLAMQEPPATAPDGAGLRERAVSW
ncbi:MAG: hypothetical protein ACKOPN_02025 [Prochlorococcaceae cyanobacterium]